MKSNSIAAIVRLGIIILAVVSGMSAIWFASSAVKELKTTPMPNVTALSPEGCTDQFFYGFESTNTGWKAQRANGSQAILNVTQTTVMAKSGQGALDLQVDLDSSNPNRRSGETFIDLASNPPIGLVAPFKLEDVPITVWFFVPAAAAGSSDIPNGVQIFVKDEQYRSEYSDWGILTNNTDRWVSFTFVPTREPPQSGYMDEGFDPTRINIIGFKIGTSEDSSASYAGPVWIDDVCWQKP